MPSFDAQMAGEMPRATRGVGGVQLPRLPPLLREITAPIEGLRALCAAPACPPTDTAQRVLLVPGLLAGDASMAPLARWLRRGGYQPVTAGVAVNVDCSGSLVARLEQRLEGAQEHAPGPAIAIGHSRGGQLACALARRRPDLVAGVISLGTPWRSFDLHPLILGAIAAVVAASALGVPGTFGLGCLAGECCAELRTALRQAPPAPLVAIYSKSDGVVDWRSCLRPQARCIPVRASHTGLLYGPEPLAAIAEALAYIGAGC